MNSYNFTERLRAVLAMTHTEAARLHHEYIGTEHLLLGLVREGQGIDHAVLRSFSVDPDEVRRGVETTVKWGNPLRTPTGKLPFTSRAKTVIELAISEARELDHCHIGPEHLLLGLLREAKGIAALVLNDLGIHLEAARAETALWQEGPQGCLRRNTREGEPHIEISTDADDDAWLQRALSSGKWT